jgi:carbon monoxide dehydrogenase subunit G
MYPQEKIEAVFTKGIINGNKIIRLHPQGNQTLLEVKWDIQLSGLMNMFTGMIKKHIKSGTDLALQSIKEELEK